MQEENNHWIFHKATLIMMLDFIVNVIKKKFSQKLRCENSKFQWFLSNSST